MKTFTEYWNIKGEPGGARIVAIYAGRFMPFHYGHYNAFLELCDTFDKDNCFIVTADRPQKVKDESRYPFRYNEKELIIKTMFGIPDNKVVFDAQPYKAESVLQNYDPEEDIVVFGVSQKDMDEDPRFSMQPLKSGAPSYYQRFESFEASQPFSKHGYIYTLKTYPIDLTANIKRAGIQDPEEEQHAIEAVNREFETARENLRRQGVKVEKDAVSGTIVRDAWLLMPVANRKYILSGLYSGYDARIETLFNQKLAS